MAGRQIPFWEETYRRDDVMTFSVNPNATVREFEGMVDPQANVLEVGCGEGQNALYLARRGFAHVDAFDLSEAGIAKLRRLCEVNGLNVNAFVDDLSTFRFEKAYDLILSFATLCFAPEADWRRFVERAKVHTNAGGIHILQTFTDTVPASEDIAPFAVGLARDGELKALYSDWEILQFRSYVFEDEHPNVPKHRHSANKIVARKRK